MAGLLKNPPANLARYLWAQLVYIPFVFCSAWYFGIWSRAYAAVYVLFTSLILVAIVRIAIDSLSSREYRFRAAVVALILAAVLTKMAFTSVQRPLPWYLAINLGEGFILSWAGILCLFVTPYTRRPDLIFPLGTLWMCQACFRFGWTINWAHWQTLNWTVPPVLGCLTFSFVAYRLRSNMCALR
jgi:hypothetical protein